MFLGVCQGKSICCYRANNADEHFRDNLLAIALIHAFKINLFPS